MSRRPSEQPKTLFQVNSPTTSCSGDFRLPHSAERKLLRVIGPGEIAIGSWNPGIFQLHFLKHIPAVDSRSLWKVLTDVTDAGMSSPNPRSGQEHAFQAGHVAQG